MIYISFGAIIISGICLKQIENKKYFHALCCGLLILTVIGTYVYTDHLDESQIDINNINNTKSMGNQAEYLPEKALKNREYFYNRSKDIIIQNGTGEVTKLLDDVPDLTFEVNTSEAITIELPRIYYMGYRLEINGQEIELTESDNGFLQATIKQSGIYSLTYEKTTIMKIGNVLSIGTFIICIILIIKTKRKVYLLENKDTKSSKKA